ncbi:54S ribosomal protein L4 mitochondrial [Tieghemiomyces parasiticus]|uniref:Large ribosomal subunit protein uL29m n=1 Tax=Tieghemiomyces parasiticus TaxID=78921 RepID=A0A9W8ADN0_9FUNG|nr:54S ribosomal protein L4 mitochondrial [Tieghemiomyces parasiticus]
MNFLTRSILSPARFRRQAGMGRGLEEFFQGNKSLPLEKEPTGRAWKASDLRNKSFEDLQKLWIVLLKERNLLATQEEEAKLFKVSPEHFNNKSRVIKCKKSMARIKTVLSERHEAYVEAHKKAAGAPSLPSTEGPLGS